MSQAAQRSAPSNWRAPCGIYFDAEAAEEMMDLPYEEVRAMIAEAKEASRIRYSDEGKAVGRVYQSVRPPVYRVLIGAWSAEQLLHRRSAAEWRRRLRAIRPHSLQALLTSVVWWDYIHDSEDAGREFWSRRIFVRPAEIEEIGQEQIVRGMRKLGWSIYHAHKRLAGTKGL